MSEIHVKNLSLRYPLYGENARSLKRDILNFIAGKKDKKSRTITHVDALKEISFSLKKGDRLGLIGHNGAGKSTLLKVLSGIFEPVQGELIIKGNVSALLGSAVGMQADLTGYENIQLTSKIKNYSKKETTNIIKNVEIFTELNDFLDRPVKTYSTGMQARLAFGISTAVHPEILILDEMIGTGDAHFIQKAQERMHHFLSKASILVLASHNTEIIKQFCNKVLWLEKGRVKIFTEDVETAIKDYLASA